MKCLFAIILTSFLLILAIPPNVKAVSPTISIKPAQTTIEVPQSFEINVSIAMISDLTAWDFKLYYPNSLLNATSIVEGPFLRKAGSTTLLIKDFTDGYNSTHGRIWAACSLFGQGAGASGNGTLAEITFKTKSPGNANLHLAETDLLDSAMPPNHITHETADGNVVITAIHDIAVVSLLPCRNNTAEGFPLNVSVTFQNKGSLSESFNASVKIGVKMVASRIVVLAAGNSVMTVFVCNTTGMTPYLQYVVSAYAQPVPGETHTSDNSLADGSIKVVRMGDVTGDGKVDIQDVARVSGAFGSLRVNDPLDPKYGQYWHPIPRPTCPHTPNADVNNDGKIDIQDLARTSANFGWHTFLSTVSVSPSKSFVHVDEYFDVCVSLDYAENLYGYNLSLSFDNTKLSAQSISYFYYLNTPFLVSVQVFDNAKGYAALVVSSIPPALPKSGGSPPALCVIEFRAIASGSSIISLFQTALINNSTQPIPHLTLDGQVNCT